jgi:hypothetical protein
MQQSYWHRGLRCTHRFYLTHDAWETHLCVGSQAQPQQAVHQVICLPWTCPMELRRAVAAPQTHPLTVASKSQLPKCLGLKRLAQCAG